MGENYIFKENDRMIELWNKYGYYHNGYYIKNHESHNYYMNRPKIRKKMIILAWLFLLTIPLIGICLYYCYYDEIGLSIF